MESTADDLKLFVYIFNVPRKKNHPTLRFFFLPLMLLFFEKILDSGVQKPKFFFPCMLILILILDWYLVTERYLWWEKIVHKLSSTIIKAITLGFEGRLIVCLKIKDLKSRSYDVTNLFNIQSSGVVIFIQQHFIIWNNCSLQINK